MAGKKFKVLAGLVLAATSGIPTLSLAQDALRGGQSPYRAAPADPSAGGLTPPGRFPGIQEAAYSSDANPAISSFAAAPDPSENDGMRSVLKRAAPATTPPATLPPATLPPATLASSAAASAPETTAPDALPRRKPVVPQQPAATPRSSAGSTTSNRPVASVAVAGKSAPLKVEVMGPGGITVGKPSVFTVNISNEGEVAAEGVQVRMALPTWVTVQAVQPTSGEAGADDHASGRLLWNIERLAPRSREAVQVQLLTRQGDAFDLNVEWTARPATARAAITVKQPQLALTMAGPTNMVFGEEKTFHLTVSNPGNGDAERVLVSVTAGDAPPQQFDAGMIPAGHKKEIPLAILASQAGSIDLQVVASGENGLESRTSTKIDIRKAEVVLALEGPAHHFAGSEATYALTVTNQGTATADNVQLSLALPAGAKYLGGLEGETVQAGTVKWKIAALPPGADRQYKLRLRLNSAGANQVAVESQATASGATSAVAETEVEAVADLKLVVNDPAGPLSTSNDAIYEIQVMNRGSLAARQVKIVMQFGEGIEPVSFDGCDARVVPGQVVCQPLPQLGPGEQASLRVVAKASAAGNHQFRVEVTATDGDARLVSEGTTRFYAESGRGGAAASTARKAGTPAGGTVIR